MAYSIYPIAVNIITDRIVMDDLSNGDYNFDSSFYTSLVNTLGEDFYADSIESTTSIPIQQYTNYYNEQLRTVTSGKRVPCLRKIGWGSICVSFYASYNLQSYSIACIWDSATGQAIKAVAMFGGTGSSTPINNYFMNVFNFNENTKVLRVNHATYAQGGLVFKDNLIIGDTWRTTYLSVQQDSDYTIGVYDCANKRILFERNCPYHQISDSFMQLVNIEYIEDDAVTNIEGVYYATIVPNAAYDAYYLHVNGGATYLQFGGVVFNNSYTPIMVVRV